MAEIKKTAFHGKCKKLAEEIRNSDVKEEQILSRLKRINSCDDSLHDKRMTATAKRQCAVENYRYTVEKKSSQSNNRKVEISLLHLAVSCERDEVAKQLIEIAPNLSKTARMDDSFKGQTPFHIAVSKRKYDLVEKMFSTTLTDKPELLSGKARGSSLKGTIMTGETPLSIAVLNCDEEMIRILKREGADIMRGDSAGNTVMHTIVMYAYYFPEKNLYEKAIDSLLKTFDTTQLRTLMHKQNDIGLTPLQVACNKNQLKVFSYFITLHDISRFNIDIWGVKDTFCYDIAELDTVRWRQILSHEQPHRDDNRRNIMKEEDAECCEPWAKLRKINKHHSALQEISQLPFKDGTEFMGIDIIDELIRKKWDYYKRWFSCFGLFHIILMVTLTYNTVIKTETFNLRINTFGSVLDTRFLVFNILNMFVGLFYIIQKLIRRFHFSLQWIPKWRLHHNTICRFVFLLFGFALLVDSFWNFASPNNYMRYVALLFGWFNVIFFLRAVKFCSYQSVLFLEIITGDMIRFLPIMIINLVPFSTAAFESFASNNTSGFDNYRESVLTLFQWMNGLGDLPDIQNEPKPALSITVFVLYVIVANIILLQTLIALMTNNDINNINRLYLRRIQRLSIIVFFESILPARLLKGLGDNVPFKNFSGEERERYQLIVYRANDEVITENESVNNNHPLLSKLINQVTHHIENTDAKESDTSRLSTDRTDTVPRVDIT